MKDLFGTGELSTNTLELAKTVYPDLAQPAVKKVGIALEMTIDFLTIPIKYLGMIGKKHDINITKHLNDLQQKIDSYPEEEIGTVPPEIGVPIIEDLTRVTNAELAEMYINLLTNASIIDKSKYAHPSFIHVIRSLSTDEAKIINHYKNNRDSLMIISLLKNNSLDDTTTLFGELFLNIDENIDLQYKENKSFYILNLEKLGLITSNPNFPNDLQLLVQNKLQEIEAQKQSYYGSLGINETLDEVEHTIVLTNYGREFIKSITL